jgi:hypothetical protein
MKNDLIWQVKQEYIMWHVTEKIFGIKMIKYKKYWWL